VNLLLSVLAMSRVDPPSGAISPVSWTIIVALGTALMAVSGFATKWLSKLYEDLKACNAAKHNEAEEILAMLRVARSQMERHRDRDRGGKVV
jgi:hypothetical protein